jgi:hypothetical protein
MAVLSPNMMISSMVKYLKIGKPFNNYYILSPRLQAENENQKFQKNLFERG